MGQTIVAPCGLRYVYQPYKTHLEPQERSQNECKEKPYLLYTKEYTYDSKRYGKSVTLKRFMRSDGATGAFDIASCGWWVHDALCNRGKWDDGKPITNWQCSQVLSDILKSEGRWARSRYWKYTTFAFGGGEARKNGMFYVS